MDLKVQPLVNGDSTIRSSYHCFYCSCHYKPGNLASFMRVLFFLQGTCIGCIIKKEKIPITSAVKPTVCLNVLFASEFLPSTHSFRQTREA